MSDKEILEAMRQMLQPIDLRLERLENEAQGIKVLLDAEIRRDINLLAEGHEMILERLPDPMEVEALDARLFAVETVIKKHSRDIQDLKKAQ